MNINEIIDLSAIQLAKSEIALASNSDSFILEIQRFAKSYSELGYSLDNEFLYFIKTYSHAQVVYQGNDLGLLGFNMLADLNNFQEIHEYIEFANSSKYMPDFHIDIAYYLDLTEKKGVYYNLGIFNLLTREVKKTPEKVFLCTDFKSFLNKIPNLISDLGMTQLIVNAGIAFEIPAVAES